TGNQFLPSRSFSSIGHPNPDFPPICAHCTRGRLLSTGTDEQVRETGDTRRQMESGELARPCDARRKVSKSRSGLSEATSTDGGEHGVMFSGVMASLKQRAPSH